MNEKLLELAKEAGFYLEPTNGAEHYAIPMLEKFAELVQASNVLDAEAKLKEIARLEVKCNKLIDLLIIDAIPGVEKSLKKLAESWK